MNSSDLIFHIRSYANISSMDIFLISFGAVGWAAFMLLKFASLLFIDLGSKLELNELPKEQNYVVAIPQFRCWMKWAKF